MAQDRALLLCAGPINYLSLPIGTNVSNAMIPVAGKPVIGWILDDLLEKGIREATVVLRAEDKRLSSFLHRTYVKRMDLYMAPMEESSGIIHSLRAGLARRPSNGLVRIILGDTLIPESYDDERDFVYVQKVPNSSRWCVVEVNDKNQIVEYFDKKDLDGGAFQALVGYYHLHDHQLLQICIEQALAAGERELSAVLRRYSQQRSIHVRTVDTWFDFGNIDNLVEARTKLLRPRHFNTLQVNTLLHTIVKLSDHSKKLTDELNWYLQLPVDLKVVAPRILKHSDDPEKMWFMQEYYAYPTVAELYLYSDLSRGTWNSLLRRILLLHKEFLKYEQKGEADDLRSMYATKTWERLEQFKKQHPDWQLVARDVINVNGKTYNNINTLVDRIIAKVEQLAKDSTFTVIHGDYCFSNILLDLGSQVIRVIDPRGSFGKKGIYGDPRYDIAKLRHSVVGMYDYITSDMYDLVESENGYFYNIYFNEKLEACKDSFDEMVADLGYDIEEIKFIEGLLFLSMTPLHKDYPERQKMMYIRGLQLLNEVLG